VLRIRLTSDYTAGTTILFNGTSAGTQLIANSDVIDFTGYANQAELAADPKTNVFVDGIKADKSLTAGAHCSVTYVSPGSFSLSEDMPANTIVELERISS